MKTRNHEKSQCLPKNCLSHPLSYMDSSSLKSERTIVAVYHIINGQGNSNFKLQKHLGEGTLPILWRYAFRLLLFKCIV